jgi:hypothetical protein
MRLPVWAFESRRQAQVRRQVNISSDISYVADGATQNPNVEVPIIIPLISIFCGMMLLILAILVTTKIRNRANNQTTPTIRTSSRPRQRRIQGTLQVLSEMSLGSIPIIKFNCGDHKDGWTDRGQGPGFVLNEAVAEATAMDTAAMQHSNSPSKLATDSQSPQHVESTRPGSPATNQTEKFAGEHSNDCPTLSNRHRPSWTGMSINCSICNEDFKHGQDVRVLPCKHGYHPTCADSWLLERSATCPLW